MAPDVQLRMEGGVWQTYHDAMFSKSKTTSGTQTGSFPTFCRPRSFLRTDSGAAFSGGPTGERRGSTAPATGRAGGERAVGCQDRVVFITSHVLAGAAIGTLLSGSPASAFAVGLASHFAMDLCPHWGDCAHRLGAPEFFLRVARCDGCAGLAAMAIAAGMVGPRARWSTVAAMVGAALPDVDKPFLHFFGVYPFPNWFRRFHSVIQRESPNRLPHEVVMAGALGVVAFRQLARTR